MAVWPFRAREPVTDTHAAAIMAEQANLEERIAELELELEDQGWLHAFGDQDFELTREAVRTISRESRIFFLKNPLIRRAVLTTTNYTFAQGVTFKAVSPTVDEVIQEFMDDSKNKAEVTDNRSMQDRDIDLQIDGNLFFVFFTNGDGDTRIRTLPFDEIVQVHTNPEDSKDPWFYERHKLTAQGELSQIKYLYPDWRYKPEDKPATINDIEVKWDNPVYHVKVNALSTMKFGLSELYSAQDWARAYNKFLSDWATIVRSYAKFAWKLTTKGKAAQRATAKNTLDSGISSNSGTTINPAPSPGSVFIQSKDGTDLSPLKTAGATTKMEDGRYLRLMMSSTSGIFEHYLTGDPSTGNLATATAMERPMQLQFINRQRLWQDIWENIFEFVIEAKARANTADINGFEEVNDWGERVWVFGNDPETGEQIDTHVDVIFPDIVEQDIEKLTSAIKTAATLDGNAFAGTLSKEYTTRQFLMALGETSVEELLDLWFPDDMDDDTRESVKQLREGLRQLLDEVKK